MKVQKRTIVKEEHTLLLDDKAIRSLLRQAGHDVPRNAEIYFYVPGGGDWSHSNLPIEEGNPIRVSWKTKDIKDES